MARIVRSSTALDVMRNWAEGSVTHRQAGMILDGLGGGAAPRDRKDADEFCTHFARWLLEAVGPADTPDTPEEMWARYFNAGPRGQFRVWEADPESGIFWRYEVEHGPHLDMWYNDENSDAEELIRVGMVDSDIHRPSQALQCMNQILERLRDELRAAGASI